MNTVKRHIHQKNRGQAMVEFSITALILFAFIFGIIDGGRMLFTYHQLTNASREGARYAVAHGIASDTQVSSGDYQAMTDHILGRTTGLNAGSIDVEASWPGDPRATNDHCPPGSNEAGCPVRVTVDYDFEPIVAMFAGVGTVEMTSSSEMRIHY